MYLLRTSVGKSFWVILFATVFGIAVEGLSWADMPQPGIYLNSDGSPLISLLKEVKESLDIEIYTMENPTVRKLVRDALTRHVKVRVVKEPSPVGDRCRLFVSMTDISRKPLTAESLDCEDQKKLMVEVREAGGRFEAFSKRALCQNGSRSGSSGCFEHGKFVLADGIALMSTGNFDSSNLCIDNPTTCNRDFSFVSSDPLVFTTLKSIFEADLAGKPYNVQSVIPSSLNDILTVSPASWPPIEKFIRGAQKSIDIAAQYLKFPPLNALLVEKAKSGVRVNLTVASFCAFGRPQANEIRETEAIYSVFDKVGISTKVFNSKNLVNGKHGYMHAKAIIVDNLRAWMGSVNGSSESFSENREVGIIFDNSAWVKMTLGIVSSDHNSPSSESWRDSLACKEKSS